MRTRTLTAFAVAGILATVAQTAMAQQQPVRQPQRQLQAHGGAERTNWRNGDHILATCIAIGNQEEVAIAKFAEDKAKSKDVKEFAQMIAKDHQEFLQKLHRFAPEATGAGYLMEEQRTPNDGRRRDQTRSDSKGVIQQTAATEDQIAQVQPAQQQVPQQQVQQPGQQAGQPVAGQPQVVHPGQPINFIQLHKEIAEECLSQAKQTLGKKEGSEFDKCFIGGQIAAHMAMKDQLVVLHRHATAEFQPVIAEGIDATEKHLKKAEEIMKKLDSSESRSDSGK